MQIILFLIRPMGNSGHIVYSCFEYVDISSERGGAHNGQSAAKVACFTLRGSNQYVSLSLVLVSSPAATAVAVCQLCWILSHDMKTVSLRFIKSDILSLCFCVALVRGGGNIQIQSTFNVPLSFSNGFSRCLHKPLL